MKNLHPTVKLVIYLVLFVLVWLLVDWLTVSFIFNDTFEFSIGKNIVAPLAAGAVFWGVDVKRDKDK